ncbi:MAG: alpha/beta hydrolase [Candidatus Omnitrophota bacterium]
MKVLKDTLIAQDGQKISYEHTVNNHDRVVIIVHGFYNSKDAVLLQELKNNLLDVYDILMFDFRGHGKSSGLFSWTSNEGKDLKIVLDYREGKYKKTGMIAFSLGASVAINVLAQGSRVDSLMCVSAASDPDKIDYNFWNLDVKGDLAYTLFTLDGLKGRGFRPGAFWRKKQKPTDNIDKVHIPVCYIHGEKDWVVKPWHSQVLYEKTQSVKKLIFIKNGSHAEYLIKDSKEEFIREVREWLEATL